MDFESIREKIAPIEALIRNPPNVGTTEDRIIQQQQIEDAKHSLVDVTTSTARAYLAAGNYEFAVRTAGAGRRAEPDVMQVPPALHALRYSIAVFGDGSSKLVPAYLLLAEANLGTHYPPSSSCPTANLALQALIAPARQKNFYPPRSGFCCNMPMKLATSCALGFTSELTIIGQGAMFDSPQQLRQAVPGPDEA